METCLYQWNRTFYFTDRLYRKAHLVKSNKRLWYEISKVFLRERMGRGFFCFVLFFIISAIFSQTAKLCMIIHTLHMHVFQLQGGRICNSNNFQGLKIIPLFVIRSFHQIHSSSVYDETASLQKCLNCNLNLYTRSKAII